MSIRNTPFLVPGLLAVVVGMVAWSAQAAPITITHGATSVTIDFTAIGNPGNAADVTGYGAVNYNYDIGTYEITTTQYNTVANATTLPNAAAAWTGDQPAAGIRYYEAAMFANWLTSGDVNQGAYTITTPNVTVDRQAAAATWGDVYVIPNDDEWYKAAFYDATNSIYVDYGTGSNTTPTPTQGSTNANDAVYRLAQEFGPPIEPADMDNAGGTSLYGTMGQSGNVAEYVEMLPSDTTPVHRGGHYSDGGATNLSSAGRGSNSSDFSTPSTVGIRIVRLIPEPGTMLLMLAGAGALAMRPRRGV